jgi:Vitamin B6 photo-protection and homoeostasis
MLAIKCCDWYRQRPPAVISSCTASKRLQRPQSTIHGTGNNTGRHGVKAGCNSTFRACAARDFQFSRQPLLDVSTLRPLENAPGPGPDSSIYKIKQVRINDRHSFKQNDTLCFVVDTTSGTCRRCDHESTPTERHVLYQNLSNALVAPFLPARYPESVAAGYSRFAVFSCVAAVAGSAGMVLSTQALLLAVGAMGSSLVEVPSGEGTGPTQESSASTLPGGAAVSTAAAAGALNWIVKDGVGQLGGVLFASRMGYFRSFDSHPKRHRLLSAMALDTANMMDICSPFVVAAVRGGGDSSSVILCWACLSSVLKNVAFLTMGASKAALHQSLATSGNLADVTAKTGSQMMAASLLGTSLGVWLSSSFPLLARLLENCESTGNSGIGAFVDTTGQPPDYHTILAVLLCLSCSAVHQVCTYWAVRSVAVNRFNRNRLDHVLQHYLMTKRGDPPSGTVLSPQLVAQQEGILFESAFSVSGSYDSSLASPIKIGSALSVLLEDSGRAVSSADSSGSQRLYHRWEGLRQATPSSAHVLVVIDERVHLTFMTHAKGDDVVRGMLHAHLVGQSIRHRHLFSSGESLTETETGAEPLPNNLNDQVVRTIISSAFQETDRCLPYFLEKLRTAGWKHDDMTHVEPRGACRLQMHPSVGSRRYSD